MFVERDERFIVQELVSRLADKVIRALLALNRRYLPDPRHKWLNYFEQRMTWKPVGFLPRLMAVAAAEPAQAVQGIQTLFLETLDLVDEQIPDADTDFAREWISYRRPLNSVNPLPEN